MIKNDNWEKLKEALVDGFASVKNEPKNFLPIEYKKFIDNLIIKFSQEAESNFLSIPNTETRDIYINNRYEEIDTLIRLNSDSLKYLSGGDKEKKNIQWLLRFQNDSLFGLTLWFKMNLLFSGILQNSIVNKPNPQKKQAQIKMGKLGMPHYSMKQVYLSLSGEGEKVTNKNKNEIGPILGYDGHKFYQSFNFYQRKSQRVCLSGSKPKDRNQLKRFELVIDLLKNYPKAIALAKTELKAFSDLYNKSYS